MTNNKRLEKYRNELESHLEKVNRSLNEEIQNMRDKIKTTKDKNTEKKNLKKDLDHRIELLEKRLTDHDKTVEALRENENKIEFVVQDEEDDDFKGELKTISMQNTKLKNQIVAVSSKINDLLSVAKKESVLQETKSLKQLLEKCKKEVEDLKRKKTAQDSAIERLRADILIAEESQTTIENSIESEIRRRMEQKSESVELQHQMEIFEKENLQIEDEFNNLMETLKEKDMKILRLGTEAEEKRKKMKKILYLNDEYLVELRNGISNTSEILKSEAQELEELEKMTKNEENTVTDLLCKYKALKKQKCITEESDSSDNESEDACFEMNMKEISAKHDKLTNKLLNKRKQISSSLTVRTSTDGSSKKKSTVLQSIKKDFLNMKREQKAMEFKIRNFSEKKHLLSTKIEDLMRSNEVESTELRRAEDLKDNLMKEIAALNALTTDGPTEVKEKTENERRVDALKEILRKQHSQNEQSHQKIQSLKKDLSSLQTKIKILGNLDVEECEKQREEERSAVRRLRSAHSDLMKKARKLQRELELCIIQRESTVNRAQSIVHLPTTIKAQRQDEIEEMKKRVAEKRQQLERESNNLSVLQ